MPKGCRSRKPGASPLHRWQALLINPAHHPVTQLLCGNAAFWRGLFVDPMSPNHIRDCAARKTKMACEFAHSGNGRTPRPPLAIFRMPLQDDLHLQVCCSSRSSGRACHGGMGNRIGSIGHFDTAAGARRIYGTDRRIALEHKPFSSDKTNLNADCFGGPHSNHQVVQRPSFK